MCLDGLSYIVGLFSNYLRSFKLSAPENDAIGCSSSEIFFKRIWTLHILVS